MPVRCFNMIPVLLVVAVASSCVVAEPIPRLRVTAMSRVASNAAMNTPFAPTLEQVEGASRRDTANQIAATSSPGYWTNVRDFGVVGDGVTDVSLPLQNLFNSVRSGTVYFPAGRYRLKRSTTFTLSFDGKEKPAAVLLRDVHGMKVVFQPGAKLVYSTGDQDSPNLFALQRCSDIEFENLDVEGEGTAESKLLYHGASVLIDQSKDVRVTSAKTKNCRHSALAFDSEGVLFDRVLAVNPREQLSGSYLALYNCRNSSIRNSTIYESTDDGDIGVFGPNSRGNSIRNCTLFNFQYGDVSRTITKQHAQGIFIDSGPTSCSVSNCYLYGYFYGIDVKTATEGTRVTDNVLEKCRVSIAVRPGEGNQPALQTTISGNTIKPTSGSGSTEPILGYVTPIGIMLANSLGASIVNNQILCGLGEGGNELLGVLVSNNAALSQAYQSPIHISQNRFIAEERLGATYGLSKGQAIVLVGGSTSHRLFDVNISDNSFDPIFGANVASQIQASYVSGLSISNNSFSDIRGDYCLQMSNCNSAVISGNTWSFHRGLLKATSCKGISFSNNTSRDSVFGPGRSTLFFDNSQHVAIASNTYIAASGGKLDDYYVESINNSDFFTIGGNSLQLANRDSTNWHKLSGSSNSLGANAVE